MFLHEFARHSKLYMFIYYFSSVEVRNLYSHLVQQCYILLWAFVILLLLFYAIRCCMSFRLGRALRKNQYLVQEECIAEDESIHER